MANNALNFEASGLGVKMVAKRYIGRMHGIAMLPEFLTRIDEVFSEGLLQSILLSYSYTYIYELTGKTEEELLKMQRFTRHHLETVQAVFAALGLKLDMHLSDQFRKLIDHTREYIEIEAQADRKHAV